MNKNLFKNPFFLAALTGCLSQVCQAGPVNITLAAYIYLIPLLVALDSVKTKKEALLAGLISCYFANLAGFYWFVMVLKNYFQYSFVESVGVFLLYSFVGQPQFILFAISFFLLKSFFYKNPKVAPFFATIIYFTIDFLTPKIMGDSLGHIFTDNEYIRQIASLQFGVLYLTLFCIFLNFLLFFYFKTKKKFFLFSLLLTVSFIVGAGASISFKKKAELADAKYHLNILIVQPNTKGKDTHKADLGMLSVQQKMVDKLQEMTLKALEQHKDIDLVVWPENSFPFRYSLDSGVSSVVEQKTNELNSFVRRINLPIILGAGHYYKGKDFNAALMITPRKDGEVKVDFYHKTILAFLGETNPFSTTKGRLEKGTGPTVFELPVRGRTVRISPIICYESLSSNYVEKAVKNKRIDLIVHLSNESWFGYYGAPISFFGYTAYRAIQNNVPLVKAGNAGVSGLVLPDGTSDNKTDVEDETYLKVSVPLVIN